jgi:formate hydrogenlyase subunit 3/multisubunit Na+/H+ antiporter MnhD subunit
MVGEHRPNRRQMGRQRPPRSRDRADRAVGLTASVLGLLVVVGSVPAPSKTGVLAMTGVLLGGFGYLLGARLLGAATVVISVVVILAWLLS